MSEIGDLSKHKTETHHTLFGTSGRIKTRKSTVTLEALKTVSKLLLDAEEKKFELCNGRNIDSTIVNVVTQTKKYASRSSEFGERDFSAEV